MANTVKKLTPVPMVDAIEPCLAFWEPVSARTDRNADSPPYSGSTRR